jgi:hypothetical protein
VQKTNKIGLLGRLLPLLLLRRTVALSRRAAIGAVKLRHTFANVRFGESAPQRRALQRMAAMGRNFGVILSVSLKRSLAAMQKTGKVGSLPTFAARYTKGRCRGMGETLQRSLSAYSVEKLRYLDFQNLR